jgi:hypothetical protein
VPSVPSTPSVNTLALSLCVGLGGLPQRGGSVDEIRICVEAMAHHSWLERHRDADAASINLLLSRGRPCGGSADSPAGSVTDQGCDLDTGRHLDSPAG